MNKVTSALLFEMSNIYRDFLLKHGIDKIFFWVAFQFELAKDVSFFIRAISVRYSKLYPIHRRRVWGVLAIRILCIGNWFKIVS